MSELPRATVVRLPRYLRLVEDLAETRATVSSKQLADAAGVNAANVRRDLSYLDFHGVRGVGYSVIHLGDRIRDELGIANRRTVGIVGAGSLGTALANYGGLAKRGFDVVVVYDNDPAKVGRPLGAGRVKDVTRLEADCAMDLFEMAILAVPVGSAQEVAGLLVEGGISTILNFAPCRIEVPDGVSVRRVDLSMELQVLSYYGKRV